MKGVVSLLFVFLLLSFEVRAAEVHAGVSCRAFFQEHGYDSYLPPEASLEQNLRDFALAHQLISADGKIIPSNIQLAVNNLQESPESIKANLENTERVIDSYLTGLSKLREANDEITRISLSEENFSKRTIQRIKEIISANLFYTAAYLNVLGVDYRLGESIMISSTDSHFLNRQVLKLYQERDLKVGFNPLELFEHSADGLYGVSSQVMYLRGEILLSRSFYQSPIALHEYIHHIDNLYELRAMRSGEREDDKPYNRYIAINSTTPELAKILRGYKKGFSVDEIRTYRATLKALIHEAITGTLTVPWEKQYQVILGLAERGKALSQVTKDTFGNYANGNADYNSIKIEKSKNEQYEIEHINEYQALKTAEMSEFTYKMYSLIHAKLVSAKDADVQTQMEVLERINKVLVIPEVRRMEGKFPSDEQMKSILLH